MKRVKTVNRLCVAAFVFLVAALTALAVLSHLVYIGTTPVVIDMRVGYDGTVFDLRDDEEDTVWLRKISPSGELLAHVKLRRLDRDAEEYSGFRILDISDDTVWLWKTAYGVDDFKMMYESLLRCELYTGKTETVYSRPGQKGAALISPKISDGNAYIGERSEGSLSVWRVPLSGGEVEYYGKIEDSFLAHIYIPSDGGIVGISLDSVVTLYSAAGEAMLELYSPKEYGAIASVSVGANDELFLYTVGGGTSTLLRVNLGGELTPLEMPGGAELLSVTAASESVWAGLDKDFRPVSSSGKVIERLSVNLRFMPDVKSALRFLPDLRKILILLAGIALTAALLLLLRNVILKRKTPLMVKQLLLALPIFAAGLYIITCEVMREIEYEFFSDIRNELVLHSEKKLSEADFSIIENINWDSPLNDENYLTLFAALSDDVSGDLDTLADTGERRSDHSLVNYWLFAVDGDEAKTAFCGSVSIELPYEYAQIIDLGEAFKAALEQDDAVLATAFDERGGKWYMLRQQIRNESGEIVGFLDVSLSYMQTAYFLNRVESSLTLRITALTLLIMLSCLTVSFLALKRLARFKQATEALREGEYGYRVRVSGNDEVTDIARAFNVMAERVETSVGAISETSRSYSRFVPSELFSILGKASVLDISPGDSAELECSLLCLYTGEFGSYAGENLFESLSRYYEAIMPAVASCGGVIERYSENEMAAIFLKNPRFPLIAAGQINDALEQSSVFVGKSASCTAVIGFHRICLGVMGHGDRLSAAIVSGYIRQSRLLGNLGGSLGCRILMTGSALAQGELPENTALRFIGNALLDGEIIPLYEVFTGGGDKDERLRATESFDEAVRLYYCAEYYKARSLFVEVIKKAPGDLVAREYLLFSDKLMRSHAPPEPLLSI